MILTFQRLNHQSSSSLPVFLRKSSQNALYGTLFRVETIESLGSLEVKVHGVSL